MRLLFGSSKFNKNFSELKLNEDTSFAVAELFVSNFDKIAIPYLWVAQLSAGWFVYGRDIDSYLEFIDLLVKNNVRHIFSFDLRELYYFIKSKRTILPCSVPSADHSWYTLSIPGIKFHSVSHICGAKTLSKLVNEDIRSLRNTRRTPESPFENFEVIDNIISKEWDYVYNFTFGKKNLNKLDSTLAASMKTNLFFKCSNYAKYGIKEYRKKVMGWEGADMQIEEVEDLIFLKSALCGGVMQYNPKYKGELLHNVAEYDLVSAYIYSLVANRYPVRLIGHFYEDSWYDTIEMERSKNNYTHDAIIHFKVYGVDAKSEAYRPLGFSGTIDEYDLDTEERVITGYSNLKRDNQKRIYHADWVSFEMLYDEFIDIFSEFYDYDNFEILDMRVYRMDFIPPAYIDEVMKLFKDKAYFKGTGTFKESLSKFKVILSWGICSSGFYSKNYNVCSNEVVASSNNLDSKLYDYNNCRGSFYHRTYNFEWGIWCTSYVRRVIAGIIKLINYEDDWCYSNTDCVYLLNKDLYVDIIDEYNKKLFSNLSENPYVDSNDFIVTNQNKDCTSYLGIFKLDGFYSDYKFLGFNKYLGYNTLNKKYKLCIGGVSDIDTKFLYKIDAFEWFRRGSILDKSNCNQFDKYHEFGEVSDTVVDYKGNEFKIDLGSGCYRDFTEYIL